MWYIVGLGNPGDGYEKTRHNTGRMIVEQFGSERGFSEWTEDKKLSARVSSGKVENETVRLVLPNTFMNKSGAAVRPLIANAKQAEQLVVVYDDLDLPLGTIKIAFGRSSAGHHGIDSIIRALRTKDFVRVRVGIAPTTAGGKLRKPQGEQQVLHFIMDPFSKKEQEVFQKATKRAGDALVAIVTEGREAAMNAFNG